MAGSGGFSGGSGGRSSGGFGGGGFGGGGFSGGSGGGLGGGGFHMSSGNGFMIAWLIMRLIDLGIYIARVAADRRARRLQGGGGYDPGNGGQPYDRDDPYRDDRYRDDEWY